MLDLGNWGSLRFRGTRTFLWDWNRIEMHRFRHTLQKTIAFRMPLWLVNWCVVRAAVLAMGGHKSKSPSEIGYSEMWNATDPRRSH